MFKPTFIYLKECSCGKKYLGKSTLKTLKEVEKYTGVMIYGHKAGATLQINTDPALTEYLINATKLKNKGSNMTSNVQQVTKYSKLSKTEGACKQTADFWNYKGRAE